MEFTHSALVVGGGIAGLSAALGMAKQGWKVTIVEGRNRLGGRIFSSQSQGRHFELGAEFIHGRPRVLWDAIKRAGLSTTEVPDKHWVPARPGELQQQDVWGEIEQVFERMDRGQPDQSFADFIHPQRLPRQIRQHAIDFVEGFNAADQHRIGVQGLAAAQEASDRIEGERAFRIHGGYTRLLGPIQAGLQEQGVKFVLGATVKVLHWRPHHVTAEFILNNRRQVLSADVAVITLPLGLLKAEAVQFEPRLNEKEDAIQAMEFGDVTKVILRFRTRFWPEARFGFIHSQDEWLPVWWSNEDEHIITGWAGGPKAERLSREEPAFVQERALEALAKIFGESIDRLRELLLEVHYHNWRADPFSLGAYSYLPVNGLELPNILARAEAETLFFAGEAMTDDFQFGTVHGAYQSGLRAVEEINSTILAVNSAR